ncbi:MAG: FKBP-type peptidyl-prolyl cis-trans isomerase [Bacteroidota bacterium]
MKKSLFLLLFPVMSLVSCLKTEEVECVPMEVTLNAPANEVSALKGILLGSGITATEDPRGFFYVISGPTTGVKPTTCSVVSIDYVAKILNGAQVDQGTGAVFQVAAFITGWQEAIPLLSKGGSMKLYLPPSLAYGPNPNGNIPGNSNLEFTIDLKDVK